MGLQSMGILTTCCRNLGRNRKIIRVTYVRNQIRHTAVCDLNFHFYFALFLNQEFFKNLKNRKVWIFFRRGTCGNSLLLPLVPRGLSPPLGHQLPVRYWRGPVTESIY